MDVPRENASLRKDNLDAMHDLDSVTVMAMHTHALHGISGT